jgi:DNA primase
VSGTALTLHHVQLLERMSEKVVLALDADRAGINAMKKGANLMLERGLDVKVAELPLGKDPADLILENPSEFKKYIGKSVHVIEFLLHVLKRESKDERSLKLSVREEVLPFVLLLPSRIDQEHFVTKIAEYIESTTEAVRFELNHLRQQKETEASKELSRNQSYDKNVVVNKKILSTDNGFKSYLFLLAAVEVLEEGMDKIVKSQLEEVIKISNIEKPSDSELSGTVFTLEQQFSDLPALAVKEEVVNKLNRLKTLFIRGKLTELKKQLLKLEEAHDDVKFTEVLKSIGEYESKLREPSYDVETLFAKTN